MAKSATVLWSVAGGVEESRMSPKLSDAVRYLVGAGEECERVVGGARALQERGEARTASGHSAPLRATPSDRTASRLARRSHPRAQRCPTDEISSISSKSEQVVIRTYYPLVRNASIFFPCE